MKARAQCLRERFHPKYVLKRRGEARAGALKMLERFNLVDKQNLYPAQLSGGQRQRLSIAQQLLCSEHYLLMDEPFSGLDPIMKKRVCELISEVASGDELMTIIVVTHDIESAAMISDTLWLMGRDRDAAGNVIPGARIQAHYNLVDLDLAWQPGIEDDSRFTRFVRGEVYGRFKTLA